MKETPSRLKAMQETVLRMNEKNLRYQAENKSLKQDLEKLMAEVGMTKEKQGGYIVLVGVLLQHKSFATYRVK